MEKYIGVKIISARAMSRLEYNEYRGWELPEDEDGADEGYLVEYLDGGKSNHPDHLGYISWSPKDVFERSYGHFDGLTFGLALEALKVGHAITRKGWNGKGMYLFISCPNSKRVEAANVWSDYGKRIAEDNGGLVTVRPYVLIKSVDDSIVPWLASQSDMLAEDWYVVDLKQAPVTNQDFAAASAAVEAGRVV